ncbi:hypothetical protein B0I33_104508 [Prauserella shujinwangii]|uniref:Uncharacterized protein n=1 Tax=Prauserella shujinwangii TaxID=1453103 RepID=A0A2T0LXD9_9PSEU|nr:hypothetical protein [Prauserella shujinwangii]PRX48690.1 hypothetical protein B0I33_104508 [Prauserella shujinwangii]
MPATPNYGLPYPALTDPPNVPADVQALAEAVDTALGNTDSAAAALDTRVDTLESAVTKGRWERVAVLNVPNFAVTTITYDTTVRASPDVTLDAGGQTFTLNRSGWYRIWARIRINGGSTNGTDKERLLWVQRVSDGVTLAIDQGPMSLADTYHNAYTEMFLAASTQFQVNTNQQGTVAVDGSSIVLTVCREGD